MSTNDKVIGVSQVLEMLKKGKTRDEIAKHYGITRSECKILFQHPDLKGRKTIKQPTFRIVEDENTEASETDSSADVKSIPVEGAVEVSSDKEEKEVPSDEKTDVKEETVKNEDLTMGQTQEEPVEEEDSFSDATFWGRE